MYVCMSVCVCVCVCVHSHTFPSLPHYFSLSNNLSIYILIKIDR